MGLHTKVFNRSLFQCRNPKKKPTQKQSRSVGRK